MHLAELHPREHEALAEVMAPFRAQVRREDGFAMALAQSPPTPRRGMVLIDPSYEVKEDYAAIPRFVAAIRRKWNVGIVALWYPILTDARHLPMLEALAAAAPGALRHEVAFGPAREGHRMVGSGLFVVNPPFGLDAEAARLTGIFAALAP
jgi:23S rRNA (adenine2030-N6)-methyltransferase